MRKWAKVVSAAQSQLKLKREMKYKSQYHNIKYGKSPVPAFSLKRALYFLSSSWGVSFVRLRGSWSSLKIGSFMISIEVGRSSTCVTFNTNIRRQDSDTRMHPRMPAHKSYMYTKVSHLDGETPSDEALGGLTD